MTNDRKKLQRELAEHLREKDRAALGLLRAQIKHARVERKSMLRVARQSCHTARAELKARQAVQRSEFVQAQRFERVLERTTCATGKENAKAKGLELELGAKRTLKDEAALQRQVRRAGKAAPAARIRTTARERSQEDDDAVRSNLPPELVPVFDKVSRKIKGSPKRTRTEAFLDWAEENPDEIIAVQQSVADKALREMLKQQRELGRTVRSTTRYKQTPEELAELLASVPF
jgi:mRNA-degrading endonuclease toxin of MazEF toxin-antitoxin module